MAIDRVNYSPVMSDFTAPMTDSECELLLRLRETPAVFEAINDCTAAELAGQKSLRAQFDDELVRAALAVHEARQKAVSLLPNARELWLTRVGLEQSTSWEVAQHKARRFAASTRVADLCCGVGVDASAQSLVTQVEAVDRSATMCLRTEWNARLLGHHERLTTRCEDVTTADWSGQIVHADPDRRGDRDRPTKRLEQYHPDLSWMQQLTKSAAGGGIKVSPASNFLQKFPGAEIELISLHGECREATVWFGELAGEHPFRATSLPTGETLAADPLSEWTNVTDTLGDYLFDPDPAIVRSGLLDVMAARYGLQRLDAEEEYLASNEVPPTAFVQGFRVEAILPNRLPALKQYFRDRPANNYEIKCRRIPIEAASVRRVLPTGDGAPRVILFARVAGRASIVIATRSPVY